MLTNSLTIGQSSVRLGALSVGRGAGVALHGASSAAAAETRLFVDDFDGALDTDLTTHTPDTVWSWDNWVTFGQSGVSWTLNGDGTVSQKANPTGAQGQRMYGAGILAPTNEPKLTLDFTTPSSGNIRAGVNLRRTDDNNYWVGRVNSVTGKAEVVQVSSGSETIRASSTSSISISYDTRYDLVVEAVGTVITVTFEGVSVSYDTALQSSVGRWKCGIGLHERITSTDGHVKAHKLTVETATGAAATSGRIFYAPANASPATEFDSVATSGTANAGWFTTPADDCHFATITASGVQSPESGVRFQWQADEAGQTRAKKGGAKNLPDAAYYTGYVYIPSVIERLGSFWLVVQMKQRNTSAAQVPVYSLNLGFTDPDMHAEPNTNMHSDGTYNGSEPDLSNTHYTISAGAWHRIDMYYKMATGTTGELAWWLDNTLLWRFTGIRTQFSQPPEDWVYGNTYQMQVSWGHYAANLNPNTSTIYWDNLEVTFGGRPPDAYPASAPV